MDVDWITVAAQIINFLVLVWLLQRFLYGPIIRAMDERDARISGQLNDAEQKVEQAEAEAGRYQEMQETWEKQREERLAQVRKESESLRQRLQSESREAVAGLRSEWLQSLAVEKADFLDDIQERAAEAFGTMARRAFGDLAGVKLEDQICRRFVKALSTLGEHDLKRLRSASARAGGKAVVRAAFDVTARRRGEIKAALLDKIDSELDVSFERTPNLICGVELRVGGQSVRWSLDSFLDEFENELRETVEARVPLSDLRAEGQAEA